MRRRRSPEIIAGRVNADGSIAAGDGFTSAKTATGIYVLAFPASFRIISCTANVNTATTWLADVNTFTANGVSVYIINSANGTASDLGFHFIAVGVQQ